jgi:hypothetical protein
MSSSPTVVSAQTANMLGPQYRLAMAQAKNRKVQYDATDLA